MESLIYVGGKFEKETAENLANFVDKVFTSGKTNNMDQSTIVAALGLPQKVVQPENVVITGCNLSTGKD